MKTIGRNLTKQQAEVKLKKHLLRIMSNRVWIVALWLPDKLILLR